MANGPVNRRGGIILDGRTQKQMVIRSTALPLTALIIGAAAMLWFSEQAFERAEEIGAAGPSFTALVVFTIVFIVGTSAVAIWLALRQSHRLVGPAHRLQKSLERIRHGELDFEVTLREADELAGLAEELNRLLAYLRECRDARPRTAIDEVPALPTGGR